jgi:oligopeptide/dipeptide ABC transporter ATP-binding protein
VIAENASRVAVMYAGRLMELAATSEIFSNPKHPYTVGLLESIPKGKGIPLKPISGTVPGPEDFPEGCRYADRCVKATPGCAEEPPFLEVSQGHFVRCGLL